MPCTDAKAIAEKFRQADWNAVLAPACFTESGLADLAAMIAVNGIEAVDGAVLEFLSKSKLDRTIAPSHVKGWAYFRPRIREAWTGGSNTKRRTRHARY